MLFILDNIRLFFKKHRFRRFRRWASKLRREIESTDLPEDSKLALIRKVERGVEDEAIKLMS